MQLITTFLNRPSKLLLVFVWFLLKSECASNSKQSTSDNHGISLVSVNFPRVGILMVVSLWILLVCITITSYHYATRISHIIPESCLLIVLGIPIGAIYRWANVVQYFEFTPDLFFLILLPPIVLDAGYFVKTRAFFENIIPILLHAILGTLFNAFALGYFLYLCSGHIGIPKLGLTHCFLFGSLISAVDPVAVLAVFTELRVHQLLFIIVFGESILNDAVTIVLYNLFEYLTKSENITYSEILTGVGSFFIVSTLGVAIGITFGLLTAFVTKYTKILRLLEPVIVLVIPYIGYLIAETFHFSGILSILFTGIVMKPYVEINISYKSKTTIQRILRAISTTSEAMIFVFLGCSLVTFELHWNTGFTMLTLLGISIFRIISIFTITLISNARKPREKVTWMEQFVMMYGGLRGAVAISLALILEEKSDYKHLFVTTAFFVVLFTVFVQGITIKPLVRMLNIKIEPKKKIFMLEEMNFKIIDHLNGCAVAICGTDKLSGIKKFASKIEYECEKFLTSEAKLERRDTILAANTDILYKEAAKLVKTNPSAIINLTKSQANITNVPSKSVILEDVPTRDTGAKLRLHQANIAKGENLFDNYVRKMTSEHPRENINLNEASDINFMTRNDSFYGPGAAFTITKTTDKPHTLGVNANKDVRIHLKPTVNDNNNANMPSTSQRPKGRTVESIPLVSIEESPIPIFTIGDHDPEMHIASIKELSNSVNEPARCSKDHIHGHHK